jgi:hypothetical protein
MLEGSERLSNKFFHNFPLEKTLSIWHNAVFIRPEKNRVREYQDCFSCTYIR